MEEGGECRRVKATRRQWLPREREPPQEVDGSESRHAWSKAIQATTCVDRTMVRLMAEQNWESIDHDGMARVAVMLLEVDRYDFEKNKIQEF